MQKKAAGVYTGIVGNGTHGRCKCRGLVDVVCSSGVTRLKSSKSSMVLSRYAVGSSV